MSDLLGIGASGLRAYSRALNTIGDNIANAQTPGYARRTLALREVPSASDMILVRSQIRPGGVEIGGVVRSVDVWLIEDARQSAADAGRTTVRSGWIGQVENALADSNSGISAGLNTLFDTADLLTADPANTTLRRQFLQAADDSATGFRAAGNQLMDLSGAIAASVSDEVGAFNTNLQSLESINVGLLKSRPGSTNEAALLDERDRLLDQLSAQFGVAATFGNRGTVTLRASSNGELLVGGGVVNPLAASVAPDGRISYAVGGQPVATATGTLAGHAESAGHVADQRAALDQLVNDVATQLNGRHQAGFDALGNPGGALFASFGDARTIAAVPLGPDQLAVADATSSNGNMLAFAGLRGAGGPQSLWQNHVAAQAQASSAARAQDAAAQTRSEGAAAARDAVSEIDLDREAADLIRFQQAYAAAAQTIQVARETMQTLLNAI